MFERDLALRREQDDRAARRRNRMHIEFHICPPLKAIDVVVAACPAFAAT
jgi:hypothetical protein